MVYGWYIELYRIINQQTSRQRGHHLAPCTPSPSGNSWRNAPWPPCCATGRYTTWRAACAWEIPSWRRTRSISPWHCWGIPSWCMTLGPLYDFEVNKGWEKIGRSWKIMEDLGRSWKILDLDIVCIWNYGRCEESVRHHVYLEDRHCLMWTNSKNGVWCCGNWKKPVGKLGRSWKTEIAWCEPTLNMVFDAVGMCVF